MASDIYSPGYGFTAPPVRRDSRQYDPNQGEIYYWPYEDPNGYNAGFVNKCWHVGTAVWVRWKTAYKDATGQEYPGPGTFGVDTNNYRVEAVSYVPVA